MRLLALIAALFLLVGLPSTTTLGGPSFASLGWLSQVVARFPNRGTTYDLVQRVSLTRGGEGVEIRTELEMRLIPRFRRPSGREMTLLLSEANLKVGAPGELSDVDLPAGLLPVSFQVIVDPSGQITALNPEDPNSMHPAWEAVAQAVKERSDVDDRVAFWLHDDSAAAISRVLAPVLGDVAAELTLDGEWRNDTDNSRRLEGYLKFSHPRLNGEGILEATVQTDWRGLAEYRRDYELELADPNGAEYRFSSFVTLSVRPYPPSYPSWY